MGIKIQKYQNEFITGYYLHCPGCECDHAIPTAGKGVPNWKFNDNLELPTFSPSLLVKYPHLSEEANAKSREFYAKHGRYLTLKELPYDRLDICHSFITNGKIKFLNDCTHQLKGQTIDLHDFESS